MTTYTFGLILETVMVK